MTGDGELRLFLLRHGETRLNAERRMQGAGSDHPLSARGRRQFRRLAERLEEEGIAAIYASDLRRALESARILGARLGLAVAVDRRLREQDLGEWEGWSWPELARLTSRATLERFIGDLSFAPPAGERRIDLERRVRECIEEIAAAHGGETVAVVTHGGPVLAFLCGALDLSPAPWNRFYASNAGVSEFERVDGLWRLLTFDETYFLGELRG